LRSFNEADTATGRRGDAARSEGAPPRRGDTETRRIRFRSAWTQAMKTDLASYKGIQAVVAAVVVVVLMLWMAGLFGTKIEPGRVEGRVAKAPEGVPRAVVEEVTVPVIEEAAGTVQAERKTIVSSRIVAVIREVKVRAGDPVAAGDPLVLLDDRDLIAKAQEAQRVVQAAEAARTKTEADYRRASQLIADGVISRSELDQAEMAFKVADADLERARQTLRAAEVSLSFAEIRASAAGRVVDRLADPGDTAMPGIPLLSLYDPSALRMEVPVRETLLTDVAVGQSLKVRLGAEAEVIDGTVDEIVPQAEAGSRTFLIKVGLPRRQGMYTGMFGRVLIPAGQRKRIVVSEAAIERIGQLDFVDTVSADGTVSRRLVTLGTPAGNGKVEILSGLRPGEVTLLRRQPAKHQP